MRKILLLSTLFAVAQPGLHAQPAGTRAEPALPDAQATGARIFQQKCAVCHLPILRSGDTPYASRLDGARVAADRAYARRVLEDGNAAGMPGWKHTLQPAQLDALMTYLTTLDGSAPRAADHAAGGSAAPVPPAAERDSRLAGTVTAAAGEPLEGVTVSARRPERPITTSVFTDERGAYVFPPLESGQYQVWAQAGGWEGARRRVELDGAQRRQDFVLQASRRLHRPAHGGPVRGGAARGHAGPAAHEGRLRGCVHRVPRGERRAAQPLRRAGLGRHRRGDGPPRRHERVPRGAVRRSSSTSAPISPRTWPRCAGPARRRCASRRRRARAATARCRWSTSTTCRRRRAATCSTPGATGRSAVRAPPGGGFGLHDATVDRDGDVWFTYNEPEAAARTVGKVDTATGRVTDFSYPRADGRASTSHGIITARDGAVWFNVNLRAPGQPGNERLGRIDPGTGTLEVFTPPGAMRGMAIHVAEDAQGNIWGDTATGAIRYDPAADAFTAFASPTQPGRTYGAAGDRDGNGWWTQIGIDVIGRADPATGASSEIRLPAKLPAYVQAGDFSPEDLAIYAGRGRGLQAPRRPAADLVTGDVWVPNYAGNNLLRIDIDSLETTYYPLPRVGMNPYMAGVDGDHRVWVSLQGGDEVAKLDPESGEWSLYAWPSRGTGLRNLAVVEHAGRVEIIGAYFNANRIGRMVMRTRAELRPDAF